MAAPAHYQLIGGVTLGFVNLVEPVYWIVCAACFYWAKGFKKAFIASSALGLLYRFIFVPKFVMPSYAINRQDFSDVLGVIIACAIINGVIQIFYSARRSKKEAESTEKPS